MFIQGQVDRPLKKQTKKKKQQQRRTQRTFPVLNLQIQYKAFEGRLNGSAQLQMMTKKVFTFKAAYYSIEITG